MTKRRRTHRAQVDEIERLRTAHALSFERLASKARINVRTLARMLQGRPVFLETISSVARVLGAPCEMLIAPDDSTNQNDTAEPSTTFRLSMTMSGTYDSPAIGGLLVTLTPRVLTLLKQHGVTVHSHDTELAVQDASIDSIQRQLVVMFGLLKTGEPCWVIAAVKPSKWLTFLSEMKAGTVNVYDFKPLGNIVVSGTGQRPPKRVFREVARIYGVEFDEFYSKMQRPLDVSNPHDL